MVASKHIREKKNHHEKEVKFMKLIIFGAQGYALGAYQAINAIYPKRNILCFLVSAIGINAPTLGGMPVREIASFSAEMDVDEKKRTQIIIATPESVQPEIEETLEIYGFYNYTRLTSNRWSELMKLYYMKMGSFLPLSALPIGCNSPFIRIYSARSHVDRPIFPPVTIPNYVFPIQVGRARADTIIADIVDNTGENISERNGNYSELTGLYWIWKNKLCEFQDASAGTNIDGNEKRLYYGFGQYRRMLEFSNDDLLRLVDNDVDVVLPYPMPYEPNIHAHHERYLKDEDWQALLTALREIQPEYADYFSNVLEQQYLYNYNVILARKKVLREYCEWLFPILERTEELSLPKGSERSDRYIGYMGETLETLYFIKNREKLNVVHTACKEYV